MLEKGQVGVMMQFGIGLAQNQGCTGSRMFNYCCALARQSKRRFPRQSLLPSGARIFYYTRRLLLAQSTQPAVNPDEEPLAEQVGDLFLCTAALMAEWLVTEFPRAVQLRTEPGLIMQRLLSRKPALGVSELPWTPAFPGASNARAQQAWERHLATFRRETEQGLLARLLVLTHPDRLPVAPVARPDDAGVALRLLQAQLAQDAQRGCDIPPVGAYLYDEPLETWLRRSLMIDWCSSRLCDGSRCAYCDGKAGMADVKA